MRVDTDKWQVERGGIHTSLWWSTFSCHHNIWHWNHFSFIRTSILLVPIFESLDLMKRQLLVVYERRKQTYEHKFSNIVCMFPSWSFFFQVKYLEMQWRNGNHKLSETSSGSEQSLKTEEWKRKQTLAIVESWKRQTPL